MVAFWEKGVLRWLVPAVLAGFLVALAVLQYRWSQEVSEATSTRMRASLQYSMMSFRSDLSRDLAALGSELRGEPGAVSPDAKQLMKRLAHWQETNALTGLVQDIYLLKFEEFEDTHTLLHLNPAEGELEPTSWPGDLKAIQPVLSAIVTSSTQAAIPATPGNRRGRKTQEHPSPFVVGGIDENIPLLIVPATKSRFSWLLIQLDRRVLEQREFPQLARRHFGNPSSGDYSVGVIDLGKNHLSEVIYSYDSDFLKDGVRSADAILNLFGPPSVQGNAPPAPLDLINPTTAAANGVRSAYPEQTAPNMANIRFDPVHYGADQSDWFIAVKHRKGSVEAAVGELRQRNLAISFGVLLVLATAIAMILFTSYRAARLARLQMEFVAGVSHELRTPVASILTIADNIAAGKVSDTRKFASYGDLIRHQARQLNHFIEQVLRFAAIRRGTDSYQMRYVPVSEVVEEALKNTASNVSSAGIAVHSDIQPGLPLLCADPRALSQCLQNLITNAVKYGGGKDIRLNAFSSNGGIRGTEVHITVEDEGIGIDPSDMSNIFDPFYRSPRVAESDVHGTGLGLALARSYAEAMGGKISVQSELGKGTVFTVHLPVENEPGLGLRSTVESSQQITSARQ
jgi:signal transduction histidine kinase